MGEIIRFPKLSPEEIVEINIDGIPYKVQVIKHYGNDLYRVKIVSGISRGYYTNVKITKWKSK